MKTIFVSSLLLVLALAGCSQPSPESGPEQRTLSNAVAQIAYGYTYRFALPVAAITQAQDLHIAQCERLGPAQCRMQEMHRSAGTSDTGGSIDFVVARAVARPFGDALLAPVRNLHGTLTARDFEAQDVTKQIAEAQAQAAEKNTAANRTAVTDARAQVETSTISVYYTGTASFGEQTGAALEASGDTFTYSIVALIYVLSAALPWIVVLFLLVIAFKAVRRWLRRQFPQWSAARSPSPYRADPDTPPTAVTNKGNPSE